MTASRPAFPPGTALRFSDLDQWRRWRAGLSGTVGFVPTMGALHAGHSALLQRSVAETDHTVLSIYVNPTQFNNAGDLTSYPSTLAEDLAIADELGVSAVLLPDFEQIYPDGYRYQVVEDSFSRELCGAHRPGHFTGVLTVVMKLLNLVRPARAYFGEKDYQQYLLIRDMAEAFFLDTEIVPCPTVREASGLALSSRNANLDDAAHKLAPVLVDCLKSEASDEAVVARLTDYGFLVDYVVSREGRRFGAASLQAGEHSVRLIDNVPLSQGMSGAQDLSD